MLTLVDPDTLGGMPGAVFGAGQGELGAVEPQRVPYKREFIQYLRSFLPDPAGKFSGLLPAQYTPEDTRPLVEQAFGGAAATAAMDNAAQHKASGDWPAAGEAFLSITHDFAGTREADEAEREFTAIGAAYGQGTLTETQMQALEARIPVWEGMNADAKHALMSFYNTALEEAVGGETREAADAPATAQQTITHLQSRALETARRFTLEEPDSLYQISSTEYWLQTAHAISPQAHAEAMAELETVLQSASAPILRLAGYGVLGVHQLRHFNKTAEALLARAEAVQAASEIALPELCARNDVAPWLKGLIGFFAAVNYMYLDRNDEALAAIDTVLPYTYPQSDVERLEFTRCRVLQAMDKYSLDGASEAFWAFVEKYPNGNQTKRALRELGGIYLRAGDYDGATLIFEQIVQRFPSTPEANAAADTLAYIAANLAAVQPVADRRPPGQGEVLARVAVAGSPDPATAPTVRSPLLSTARTEGDLRSISWRGQETRPQQATPDSRLQSSSLCGPKALQRMLELSGTAASVEELAQLAGTTETGTSLAGLLAAAKEKGLPLTAVEATRFDTLTPPFIAHVDGDHFLVIEAMKGGMFQVFDDGKSLEIVEGLLSERWGGVALVGNPNPQLTQVPAHFLTSLEGADGHGAPDADEECDSGSGEPGCGAFQDAAITPWGRGGMPPAPPVMPPVLLPGTPAGVLCMTGVSSPGVHPAINAFDTSLRFTETDIQVRVDGALRLHFTRTYRNSKGFNRGEFTGTGKPWNRMGDGWTHNYNMFLQTSTGTPPSYVLWIDASGSVRRFDRDGATSNYYRDADGATASRGDILTRNQDGSYTLTLQKSVTYEFSVPTTDANRYARLESILDSSANEVVLTYDSQHVATGKLTKVSGPAGDLQHYVLSYTNGLLTKVEFKKTENQTTTLLQDVEFAYTSNELTTVTDNDAETVTYTYGSAQGIAASRYISQVTDKRGNSTAFAWYYDTNPDDLNEAYKIELTNAAGLKTAYDRNLSSDVCTITNWDSTTQESKFVFTPVDSSTQKPRYRDYYIDSSNYERWEYAYDGNGDMVQLDAPGQVDVATYTNTTDGRFASATEGATGPEVAFTYTEGTPNTSTTTGADALDTDYEYNAAGQVTLVKHPSLGEEGNQYGHDGEGNLTSVTNPIGEVRTFAFDDKGDMTTTVIDPEGLALDTIMIHDDFGNVTERTDPRGMTTTFTYNPGGCGECGGGTGQLLSTEDPLGHITEFEYDVNGNRTLVHDALARETAYHYDVMNRLYQIDSPAGSQNYTTFNYNKLGQLVSQTNYEGITTGFEYDHTGRQEAVLVESELTAENSYTAAGQLHTVTDGNNHTTTYNYDSLFRLEEVVDHIGKETHYAYDSASRRESVAGGVNGDFDPTEYFYSETTGLLEKVRYHFGPNENDYDDAFYYYDDAARLREIDDWMSATAGHTLRYNYDAAGRLETLTDYDDSTLVYEYDDAGNVTSMTDYHGNETTYGYDDAGRLTSVTAPGSKTWEFSYNDLNQPTVEELPNGMATYYTYDTRNRLEMINHKTGTGEQDTTVESFDYTLDDDGNITRIDEHSGAFWVYGYDDGNRLTSAVYTTDWGYEAEYTYAYDDGDNMTQKVEPFAEDFNDGNRTGWNVASGGSFDISNYYAENNVSSTSNSSIYINRTEPDSEIRFSYYSEDTSNNNYYLRVYLRNGTTKWTDIRFHPNQTKLMEWDGSQWNTLDVETGATTSEDTWYDVVAKLDGANITISRAERGQAMTEILSTTASQSTTNAQLWFLIVPNAQFRIDDIKIIDGATHSTWAMTCNNANELTQMTNSAQGATIDFDYDAYGRTTEKTMGSKTATYAWAYDSKLLSIDTDFPDEQDSTFDYGADGARRSRTVNGTTTNFRWGGNDVINEENGSGTLTRFYAYNPTAQSRAVSAQIDGANPASGAPSYFLHDHLGSTRRLYDTSKSLIASHAFDPYGNSYGSSSSTTSRLFTGHEVESDDSYFSPHRYYTPATARWIARDPIGMVDGPNSYGYVRGNPIMNVDPKGTVTITNCGDRASDIQSDLNCRCTDLAAGIEDETISNCVSQLCESGSIRCPGRNDLTCLFAAGYREPNGGGQINLCANTALGRVNILASGWYAPVAVHEWAHACGWPGTHPWSAGIPRMIRSFIYSTPRRILAVFIPALQ